MCFTWPKCPNLGDLSFPVANTRWVLSEIENRRWYLFYFAFFLFFSFISLFPSSLPSVMASSIDKLQPIPNIPFDSVYEFFMDWKTPLAIAATYATVIHFLNPASTALSRVEAKKRGIESSSKSSKPMTAFVFLHNLALAIYSIITFYNMAGGINRAWIKRDISMHDAVCKLYIAMIGWRS